MADNLPVRFQPPAMIDFPTMVQAVIAAPNFDPSVLERILAMQMAQNDYQGKAALNQAIADIQTEVQPVIRDATNPHLRTRYASLQAYMDMLQPLLKKYGVRVGFDVGARPGEQPIEPGHIRARIVLGIGTYSEDCSYIDMSTSRAGSQGGRIQMNEQQGSGSAMTYSQRYLLRMKFNLTTAEDDDDGEGAGRDTQGTAGAEAKQRAARAGMTAGNGTGAATGRPWGRNAEGKPYDVTRWADTMCTRLAAAQTAAGAEALLAAEPIRSWLDDPSGATTEERLRITTALAEAVARIVAAEPPVDPAADLLKRIAVQPDIAGLDALIAHPEFNGAMLSLSIEDQDRVTAAMKARDAELKAG